MRSRRLLSGLWLLLVLLAAGAAPPEPVPIRSGNHEGFGRLVFDFPVWVGWRMTRHHDVVRLSFSQTLPFGPDPPLPRNVRALTDVPGQVELTVAPGARVRRMRVGVRLVLDVLDPARPHAAARDRPSAVVSQQEDPARQAPVPAAVAAWGGEADAPGKGPGAKLAPAASPGREPGAGESAGEPAGATKAAGPPASISGRSEPHPSGRNGVVSSEAADGGAVSPKTVPSRAAPPDAVAGPASAGRATAAAVLAASSAAASDRGAGLPAAAPQPDPAAVPIVPAAPSAGPVALAAAPLAAPVGTHAAAVLVPFEASVGAAAFRRAGQGIVVFDTPRPIDLAALRGDPVFGSASVHLLAAGTELLLNLPPDARIALQRRPDGWEVAVGDTPALGGTIRPRVYDGKMLLPVPGPGRVVSLLDPETGAPLLVGTERDTGAGLAVVRRAPQFDLLASWQGVAVEALSDRLALRADADGFVLEEAGGRLALTPSSADTTALTDAAMLTRRFRFPALPTAALAQRLQAELTAAARRPPLARGPLLRRAARSMIALGMGAEAGALLHLAAAEDPREELSPEHAGLVAVAALLAGHPQRAEGIEAADLSGSDEIALWRAVRAAELEPGASRAAQLFAATAPLVLTYPPALRRRLLPLAAETMIAGGEIGPASRLLDRRPEDPRLALARGMLAAARGRTAAALAIYDRLAQGADRLARIRAATRAVALRLATHQIEPAQAADALDRLLDAWRGGPRELALRETLARLRAQAGQWGRSFSLLRRTIADFPAARPKLRAQMRHVFAAMLADPRFDQVPPLRFVALLDANADLLPKGRDGERAEAQLADRLLALDLPDQAAPVLEKLMHAAPTPAGRAGFGARLAALRLGESDPGGALKALADSAADGLSAALASRRAVLAARAQAAEGHVADAMAALRGMGTADADRAAAAIAEQAGDWAGAERALRSYVTRALPADGRLDPAERQVLLRLATATVRAGDAAEVATLRGEQARMGTGPLADMFRLLTGPAVHSLADLPRVGTEAALAGQLGAALKAVR